jgi:hypothetical protein
MIFNGVRIVPIKFCGISLIQCRSTNLFPTGVASVANPADTLNFAQFVQFVDHHKAVFTHFHMFSQAFSAVVAELLAAATHSRRSRVVALMNSESFV